MWDAVRDWSYWAGGSLRASLTAALVLHVRTWRSAALAWEQPSSAPLCSFQPSAGTAPEGGLWRGGASLGSGQGETRTAGLLCHGARTPEGGKTPWETQAAPSKATPCGLETRPEWGHCMEHSRVLAWLGVDWVRF